MMCPSKSATGTATEGDASLPQEHSRSLATSKDLSDLATSKDLPSDAAPWNDCLEAVISCLRTHVHDAALLHKACNALWVLLRRAACEIKYTPQLPGEGLDRCAQVLGGGTKEDAKGIQDIQNIKKARSCAAHEGTDVYLPGEGTSGALYGSLGEGVACVCAEALLSTMCRCVRIT
jgi:hypothetical protein